MGGRTLGHNTFGPGHAARLGPRARAQRTALCTLAAPHHPAPPRMARPTLVLAGVVGDRRDVHKVDEATAVVLALEHAHQRETHGAVAVVQVLGHPAQHEQRAQRVTHSMRSAPSAAGVVVQVAILHRLRASIGASQASSGTRIMPGTAPAEHNSAAAREVLLQQRPSNNGTPAARPSSAQLTPPLPLQRRDAASRTARWLDCSRRGPLGPQAAPPKSNPPQSPPRGSSLCPLLTPAILFCPNPPAALLLLLLLYVKVDGLLDGSLQRRVAVDAPQRVVCIALALHQRVEDVGAAHHPAGTKFSPLASGRACN
jgi:hypothetical protein